MNEAIIYGVTIQPTTGTPAWRAVSVRRIEAAGGRHNVYVDVLTPTGERDRDPNLRIGWTWEGRRDDEQAPPVPLNKPDNGELGHGDIPIYKGQKVAVWIEGSDARSDLVRGMHTDFPDDGMGNTWGHWAYKVIFELTEGATQPADPPVEDGEVGRLRAAIGRAIAELEAALV